MGNCIPQKTQNQIRGSLMMEPSAASCTLNCSICNKECLPHDMVIHLDNCHYLKIVDNKNSIGCQCLICDHTSSNILSHNVHLKTIHYLEDRLNQDNRNSLETNSTLKDKIHKIDLKDVHNLREVLSKEGKKVMSGNYQGTEYLFVETKEGIDQRGLTSKQVESNLIWRQILSRYPMTAYFALAQEEGVKRGYLLQCEV